MSDRLVNIRMNADLSQTIQQFNLLNQSLTNLRSTMSSVGMGGGGGIGMGGGGGTGMALGGGGGFAPSGAGGMPGTGRQIASGTNSTSSIGRPGGRDVTSMMFGLSQIGFALEDYQFAGWRGVMNNVPWIANSLTSLVAPAMAPYALLGTAIGVPLANMAYENMSPQARNSIRQAMGGLGMSPEEMQSVELEQLNKKIQSSSGLDYRKYEMRRKAADIQRGQGLSEEFMSRLANPYEKPTEELSRSEFESGLNAFSEDGGFGPNGRISKSIDAVFNKDLQARTKRDFSDWWENSSVVGRGTHVATSLVSSAWKSMWDGKSVRDHMKEDFVGDFKAKANAEITERMEKVSREVGEAIKSGDKEKLKKAIGRPYVPDEVREELKKLLEEIEKAEAESASIRDANYQASQMSPTERAARSEGGDMFVGPLSKSAMQKMDFEQRSQNAAVQQNAAAMRQDDLKQENARFMNRRQSSIQAIVAGAPDANTAAERVSAFMLKQGASQDQVDTMITQQWIEGVQQAKDDMQGNSDEEKFSANSAQWIATVKSDILQAQFAATGRRGFNQRVFNTYLARIKQRIMDDLKAAGFSNPRTYLDIIWNAAMQDAQTSYKDARSTSTNKLSAAGIKNASSAQYIDYTMQELAGQMSDDLTAVYGNAQTNSFMLNRMYQQQLRRNQILMNRFMR